MDKNYIAVDLGATSGRVILASWNGEKVEMQTLHRFPTPLVEKDGKYFWDIFVLEKEILEGLGKAAGKPIESIGIDTWGVDFCCVDAEGKVSMPRAYRDPYTQGVPEQFFREMPREELYLRTGIQIMNFNSVFQAYARKEETAAADKLLFIPDTLSYMLTGKMVCEYTILSTSALMNPRTKELDEDILKICGLRKEQFPPLVLPGAVIGPLSKEVAEKTGLGPVPVIAVAGHDTGSAVAAVPAVNANFAYLSSGTWSLMGIESAQPVITDETFRLNFTNEGGVKGDIRLLKNITGMWILEQCLAQWRKEGRNYTYAELADMARGCTDRETQLFDPDDPDFAAPQNMPATLIAKTGHALSDMQMVRLIYDSLAAKCAKVFQMLQGLASAPIDTLHIIGGGSQNDVVDQLTADACGVRVVAGPAEGTALGNVMIQAGLSRKDILASINTKIYTPHE